MIKALLIVACISGLLQSHRDQRVDGSCVNGKVTNCRKFGFIFMNMLSIIAHKGSISFPKTGKLMYFMLIPSTLNDTQSVLPM